MGLILQLILVLVIQLRITLDDLSQLYEYDLFGHLYLIARQKNIVIDIYFLLYLIKIN
jgi:hypothetical protein